MGQGGRYCCREVESGNLIKAKVMPGGYLFGWDPDASDWVKVVCNPDGELDIDATAIFENPPTEDEAAKGPSSEWAFDHNANAAAHHARYTDVESRAAIGNILDSDGKLAGQLDSNYNNIKNITHFVLRYDASDNREIRLSKTTGVGDLAFITTHIGVGYVNCGLVLYRTDHFSSVIHDDSFQAALALYLEETPTNGVVNKAPTSNWAFDHDADVDAHHAKYTDAEAVAACGLDGDLYHSIPGIDFKPDAPDTVQHTYLNTGSLRLDENNVTVYCGVKLPDGVTVTAVKVDGNVSAGAVTWIMYRVALSDQTTVSMATHSVPNEDTTISYATIDNSLYTYFITATPLSTSNEIYSARIKFTL